MARFDDPRARRGSKAAGPLALVLVGVPTPGNAGTLLRSAEAAGGGVVLFSDGSVDPYGPKCVRASAGSVFRLAVVGDVAADEALAAVRAAGATAWHTVARGARPTTPSTWPAPWRSCSAARRTACPPSSRPSSTRW